MPAVPLVSVKHVQQRAGEEQDERKELHHVRTMLGEQEVRRDEQERPEHPPAVTASRREATVVRVAGHVGLDPVVVRPAIQPNSAPRANDHAVITTSA